MKNTRETIVAVIGAGLTGLTTAFYLKRAGIPFHIFEKTGRTGGVIHTRYEEGFIFESGPNTGVLSHPEALELFSDLQISPEIARESAKARWIWKSGKWVPLPGGLVSGISTPLFTFRDKIRLLGEPFRKPGNNPDETLKEMVIRRMGRSFLDYAVDPFILGIYAGDPEKLVTRYALPKLYRLEQEYGSFIGGSIKKARIPKTDAEKKATREIFSVKGGLAYLIDTLSEEVGIENITLNCGNPEVDYLGDHRFSVGGMAFTHVISTTPAPALPGLFPFAPKTHLETIGQMEYAKVVQVSLGFKKWEGIAHKAFGGLVPSRENREILGVLFPSSFLSDRAPGDGALLSVFLGGVRKPGMIDASDEKIISILERELIEMMHLPRFSPDLLRIFRYPHAIPQYGKESQAKLEAIKTLERDHPGLILAGNIRDGIGMADRIRQGRILSDKIKTWLAASQ
jgi:oxygen-dependent protoporphyrinogen oxidase